MGAILQYRPRPRSERRMLATEQRRHDSAWIMDVGAIVLGGLFILAAVGVVAVCILSLRVAS